MRRYLGGRLLQAVGVVFLVTTLTFLLVHLAPGDPLGVALERPGVTAEVRAQWRQQFGLDRPIAEQYVRWLANVPRGELGYSFSHHRPVRDVLGDALPRTLLLIGLALALSFAVGIAVGVLQAERLGGARDRWLGRGLLLLYSVPDFWLALLALLLFAYKLPILPAGGIVDPVMHDYLPFGRRVLDRAGHLVLPVLTLTLLSSAVIARHQRAALSAVLPSDWMRTALAAGAVFVEKVYSWPGMGMVTVSAIAARDYSLITAGVLFISAVVVVGALIADLAVAVADPRVRMR